MTNRLSERGESSMQADKRSPVSMRGRVLVTGQAQGALLHSTVALSLWGGIDPTSGLVIDQHHPLAGACVTDTILALPAARGSCTGSSVMLELILNGNGPAGLVLAEPDEILTLGVLVAQIVFARSIPVICIGHDGFSDLVAAAFARVAGESLHLYPIPPGDAWEAVPADASFRNSDCAVALTANDQALLDGACGSAAKIAMQILVEMAALQGAKSLIDVRQAHIDGCIYTGEASLRFARHLVEQGAKVRVPTTLNAISVDRQRWRRLGIAADVGEPADALAQAYVDMGAEPSFTCAPYLLDRAPLYGEHIGWAESNAVVFANSVLGARTQKYPDFLDVCIALTGRAPLVGCHLDQGRFPTLKIVVEVPTNCDDSFYPLLGYHIGLLCGSRVPFISGLEGSNPSIDDLKSFGAAFATTSGAPMFHVQGCTPEAVDAGIALEKVAPYATLTVTAADLAASWHSLDNASEWAIGLVAIGSPHVSLDECARLAKLCLGRTRSAATAFVVTLSRSVLEAAARAGYIETLEAFGATMVTDTCWCMLGEPVVPPSTRTLMTNSGKYAYYAPALVNRSVHFGSLADCVEAACTGGRVASLPRWLQPATTVS